MNLVNLTFNITYNIETPSNSLTNDNLAISESGANIHLANIATPKISPVICTHTMEERLVDGNTMDSMYVTTLPPPVLSKESRKIHISPAIKKSPLISMRILRDDGCTITLNKQTNKVQNI